MSITPAQQAIINKYTLDAPGEVKLVSLAEELGLTVYQTNDFLDSDSGLIAKEDGKYVIYVNKSHPQTRKRFTIAHEIAHFLLHKDILDEQLELVDKVKQPTEETVALHRSNSIELTAEQKQMEIDANNLAAEILMPEQRFKDVWKNSSCISDVADVFSVSQAAATIRGIKLFNEIMM